MLPQAARSHDRLDEQHPCYGCAVRPLAICSPLGCDDLDRFRRLGCSLNLEPGQPLFHQGDRASRVFSITSGFLKLYRLLADGRRQITGFGYPGDFLGLADAGEHDCNAEALSRVQLCSFPKERFGNFVAAEPAMERELYLKTARELAAAQEQIVMLGRKTAVERLATFLIGRLERAELASGRSEHAVDLPMTRADIADYLGLTKETVSRVLSRLRSRRLVRLQTLDRIEIVDRVGLAATAAGAA